MKRYSCLAILLLFSTLLPAAEESLLRENDVVGFIGGTAVVGLSKNSYLETLLTAAYPQHALRFRNLAWEGDTVYRQDREHNFGEPFKHAAEQKVTVLFVSFGQMESFEGEAKLPAFVETYRKVLEQLSKSVQRIVLVTPTPFEQTPRVMPDAKARNKVLKEYAKAIKALAEELQMPLIDLSELPGQPTTANGIHPSEFGYWHWSALFAAQLGYKAPPWKVTIDGSKAKTEGATVKEVSNAGGRVAFKVLSQQLPLPRFIPSAANRGLKPMAHQPQTLVVKKLPPGNYRLSIDGKEVLQATEKQFGSGVDLNKGPEAEQTEKLRALIVQKNTHVFNYLRPQNWAFLSGERTDQPSSRRHDDIKVRWFPEEMEQFVPRIRELETQIHKLATPVEHTFEIVSTE